MGDRPRLWLRRGVGSRAKAARTRQRLEAKGLPAAAIDGVRMPVGAEIGARTPAEISVAIAAELVAWRSRASDDSDRSRQGSTEARSATDTSRTAP